MRFHGGINTEKYLDFSVNVPVKPLDRTARQYIERALNQIHRYPSIDQADLSQRLEECLGLRREVGSEPCSAHQPKRNSALRELDPEQSPAPCPSPCSAQSPQPSQELDSAVHSAKVILGAGATALIYAAGRLFTGRNVLIIEPTFTEYEAALSRSEVHHCNVFDFVSDDFVSVNYEKLRGLITEKQIEVIYFCNPNNPIGYYLEDFMEGVLSTTDVDMVVDESFIDFVDDINLRRHAERTKLQMEEFAGRLIIIRSMTKAFSVPGLRIGYAISSGKLAERLKAEIEPWSVSTIASAFLESVLDTGRLLGSGVNIYEHERERVRRELGKLGYFSYPSRTNYILFKAEKGLNDFLNHRGINIRTCADFAFLGEEYYRIAIRSREENDRLIAAMNKQNLY